jgi:hypothetical protein
MSMRKGKKERSIQSHLHMMFPKTHLKRFNAFKQYSSKETVRQLVPIASTDT